ncbi:protein THEM6-like [Tribolium madens]|uniref:protein THEM6-like n=1 Tax=Tribolium madens TaxID=41895 RepID=UPI001CF766E0|nr:protein THEM6-like [Tribolium madens]
MMLCYILFGVLILILFLYSFLEIHYFLRASLCVLLAKMSRKKVHLLSETVINGICLTNDIDSMLTHMNNARFLRELDFAKIDFYERTGLYKCIKKHGGGLVLGASTIRYRRFIKLFQRYQITTKVKYWDKDSIYMEHRFLTPSDNFINAIVLCRTRLTNCNVEDVINEVLVNSPVDDLEMNKKEKPEVTPELAIWIEYNETSSVSLKSNK